MNTIKLQHFIIGLSILLGFSTILYTGLLFYTKQAPSNTRDYLIYFTESAGGLSPGSPVKFKGITIGTVDKLSISQEDNDRIDVLIKIPETFKVKQGMYAVLEVAGITGESLISLNGTAKNNSPLEPSKKDGIPVIPVQKSSIQKIINSAPEVLTGAKDLIDRVSKLFDEKNKEEFDKILKNINKLFNSVQDHQENIEEIVNNILIFTRSINSVTQKLEGSLGEIDKSNQAFRSLAHKTGGFINTSEKFVKDISPGLQNFSNNGLNDISHALLQLTDTLKTLDTFVSSLNDKLESVLPDQSSGTYEFNHAS